MNVEGIINKIQLLLKETEAVPLKEGGIIIPSGFEATIEARAIRRCLKIIKEEAENVS